MANETQVSARGPYDGRRQKHPHGSYVCILVTDERGGSYRPVYISRLAASDLVDEINAILTSDPERDAELERLEAMTPDEIDAELLRMGADPDVLAAKNEMLIRHTVSVFLAGSRSARAPQSPDTAHSNDAGDSDA